MTALPDFAASYAAVRDALHEEGLRWDDVARNTEPADRPTAEAAVRELYRLVDRRAPAILWVGSPRGLQAAAALVPSDGIPGLDHVLATPNWGRGAFAPWALDWTTVRALFGASDRTDSLGRQIAAAIDSVAAPDRVEPKPDAALAQGLVGEAAWSILEASLGDVAAEAVAASAPARMLDWAGTQRNLSRWRGGLATGNLDHAVALAAAARDVLGIISASHPALLDPLVAIARSAGPWLIGRDRAILSERPLRLRLDDRGRLHATDGPALAYRDGAEAFAIHGVAVPRQVVTDPDAITVAQIDGETNAEIRRVLVEQFGEERLIREGGAVLIREDETGRLWRRELGSRGVGAGRDEPVVMVEVVNSTPESDGSRKTYLLRVPPTMQTPREAVAWTFGLGAAEYRPEVES